MTSRFSQYILESNGDFVLNEKLGNLNASNDPQYKFVLKAVLQNKAWRGNLIGPGSKIVTLTGKGRSQFIKDLRDVQKKIGDPQLIFLTTEYKTLMIKNSDPQKYDDENGFTSNPINAHWQTSDIVVSNNHMGSFVQGPALPKAEIEHNVLSAKGNYVIRRLKNSLDNAALDDDTEYHAIVILPDLGNIGKAAQRNRNKTGGDKYAVGSSGTTRFMNGAKYDAEQLRYNREKEKIGYQLEYLTFGTLTDLLFDPNMRIYIDGVPYNKGNYKHECPATVTEYGHLKLMHLTNVENEYNVKSEVLVYNFKTKKFTIESKW